MVKVIDFNLNLGCDPEFFLRLDGEVSGSETLLGTKPSNYIVKDQYGNASPHKVIVDGVQAELNPYHSTCREILASNIKHCFSHLASQINKSGKNFTTDFSRTVEISKEKLMELDEKSRKFGCAPSQSIVTDAKSQVNINAIDPSEYRIRAAGGHIHLGFNGDPGVKRALGTDHKRTIEMLDLLCGNTAVLIDRDAGNIERRKVYGRAGEYRQPAHGLEYRTLSNFWLTASPLMSLVFGMARLSVQLMSDKNYESFYKGFTSRVNREDVINAINNNDFALAVKNFHAIESLLLEVVTEKSSRYPIRADNIVEFKHFVNTIQDKGLTYWFKKEPMKHWIEDNVASIGFHEFINGEVKKDLAKKKMA